MLPILSEAGESEVHLGRDCTASLTTPVIEGTLITCESPAATVLVGEYCRQRGCGGGATGESCVHGAA